MLANTGASRVYFWGQEMVIARRARDAGLSLEGEGRGTGQRGADFAELGLPLIGPELPDYPELIALAAAKWLHDV